MQRFFTFMILLVVSLGSAPGQGNSDAVLARLGKIEVHSLPHASHGNGPLRSRPFLPPDADVFEQEKSQAQSGAIATTATVIKGSSQGLIAGAGFQGLALSDTPGYVPPDTQVAAGLNSGTLELVEMVNGTLRISDGIGNVINTIDLCGFFLCDFFTEVISDPIVRYDPGSQRWFGSVVTIELVQQGLGFVSEGQWRLAVSSTSDPNGAWTVYGITMSNGTFPDFPKLGISSDKVVQTGDAFTISTSRFKGTEFAVLNKQDLLNGVQVPGFQYFGPSQGLLAIHSVISSSSTLYMAAVGSGRTKTSSSLQIWKLNGVPNTSGSGVNVTTTAVPVAPFTTPPNAPQLGSTFLIATNGDNLVDAVYNAASQSLWVSANSGCVPAGDSATRSCLRFVQISLAGSTPALLQDLTFGEAGEYYYYPAVAFDQAGNLIAVFNRSSKAEYVGVYAGGQLAGSSYKNTFQEPVLVKLGETAYTVSSSPSRWGDYSGASVDPAANSVWLAGEYAQTVTGGGNQWGTWIASAHF
jgi:hypothetical protein